MTKLSPEIAEMVAKTDAANRIAKANYRRNTPLSRQMHDLAWETVRAVGNALVKVGLAIAQLGNQPLH